MHPICLIFSCHFNVIDLYQHGSQGTTVAFINSVRLWSLWWCSGLLNLQQLTHLGEYLTFMFSALSVFICSKVPHLLEDTVTIQRVTVSAVWSGNVSRTCRFYTSNFNEKSLSLLFMASSFI